MLIFALRNFDLFARKIINVWGCNTSHDWQVKTIYSWCGLSGRKSLFKTNVTAVPSLTSPPPSLLVFRAPFYFAPLPTIWTPGTGYNLNGALSFARVCKTRISSLLRASSHISPAGWPGWPSFRDFIGKGWLARSPWSRFFQPGPR